MSGHSLCFFSKEVEKKLAFIVRVEDEFEDERALGVAQVAEYALVLQDQVLLLGLGDVHLVEGVEIVLELVEDILVDVSRCLLLRVVSALCRLLQEAGQLEKASESLLFCAVQEPENRCEALGSLCPSRVLGQVPKNDVAFALDVGHEPQPSQLGVPLASCNQPQARF